MVHLNNVQPIDLYWNCRSLIMPITIGWVIPLILTALQTTIFHMNSNVKCWWENTDFDPVSIYIIQGKISKISLIEVRGGIIFELE